MGARGFFSAEMREAELVGLAETKKANGVYRFDGQTPIGLSDLWVGPEAIGTELGKDLAYRAVDVPVA
jgi:hypothetical protein